MPSTSTAGPKAIPVNNTLPPHESSATVGSEFDSVRYCDELNTSLTPDPAPTQSTSGASPKTSSNVTPERVKEKFGTEKVLDVGASVGRYLGGWGVLGSAICEFFRGDDRGTGLARGAGTVAGGVVGLTAGSIAGSAIVTGASLLAVKLGISAAVAATPIGLLGLGVGVGAYFLGGYLAGTGADLFERWFGKGEVKPEAATS